MEAINDGRINEDNLDELHHSVFNTNYFIIGHYQSNKWIADNFEDAFSAIEIVKEYEVENFGQFNTKIDSENIANMLSFICGEHVIAELDVGSMEELKESLFNYIEDLMI
jgi:hypothetical protein